MGFVLKNSLLLLLNLIFAIEFAIAFEIYFYLCPVSKGCSKKRAEIIPNEPRTGNAV